MTLQQDTKDYRAGYLAGLAGKPDVEPVDVQNRLAWGCGYTDGQAERRKTSRVDRET
jgi:hypothetical protein